MSYICENIGERLRRKRLDVGYTQEHLAELADLHPTYIGQVERGEKILLLKVWKNMYCIGLSYG